MKKATLLIATIAMLAISLPVFAQEFPDVPADHWAYQSITQLVDAGIIQGYPDGTFGGKRAMTRYEFAEALAKAIPAIEAKVLANIPAQGTTPTEGPVVTQPGNYVTPEQLAAVQKMVDEFRDELAALGVDVEGLRRDVAALNDRVGILETEVNRVKITGDASFIGYGAVDNTPGVTPFDKDSRSLAGAKDVLANSQTFMDFNLGIKGKVSDNAFVKAMINAGDYTDFALSNVDNSEAFRLWEASLDTSMSLGPLGQTHVVAGRFPFQVTPLTMKFVDPDVYTNVARFDNGDFVLDGVRASFNLGPVALTAFGAKVDNQIADLLSPDLQGDIEVSQIGGAHAVIGTSFAGNVGLTYIQSGLAPGSGRVDTYGADLDTTIGSLGLTAEYAHTRPSDQAIAVAGLVDDANNAWNANLNWTTGKLALGGGYTTVESNYVAPGYWSDYGRAVNLTNVQGPTAKVSYGLSSNIKLTADAAFLQPKDGNTVNGRTNTSQAIGVTAAGLDQLTAWKAGINYGLSATNSIDLGYENVRWEPIAGANTEERYITLGIGHSFNPNAGFKLLYQIVEFEAGAINPYAGGTAADYRGGRAAAQVNMKF